jgi:two-component system, chemotaxis family, protein-glutamate methylesterase/glutaminase
MSKIRVLMVEDSATVRGRLHDILAADPDFELVGEAADGKAGIELCQSLRPNVVTMDMMLPEMSGLAATEYIMAHCPTPILIVSSSVNRGELFKTYEALAAGAVDVLEKPAGDETDEVWERRFVSTLKLVSRIKVITHPRGRLTRFTSHLPAPASNRVNMEGYEVVAIGASTGGPRAIIDVLRGLHPKFPLPILLVLHINAMFASAFAEWLDGQSNRRAAYAREGDLVEAHAGRVVIAPPDRHLIVRNGRLRLTDDPERHSCRPSVDVLFESVAHEYGPTAAAVLLTGMGRDGATGLLHIRRAGGFTIAQDEATSVVYGMPREAALIGAAQQILPVGEIADALGALSVNQMKVSA